MTQPVTRKWLLALGIASALAATPAFAAKDVVVAVGSNFTTLDPYDANDTLSQAVAKSFYQGLFGLDKEMKAAKRAGGKLYRFGGWAGVYHQAAQRGEIPGWHRF